MWNSTTAISAIKAKPIIDIVVGVDGFTIGIIVLDNDCLVRFFVMATW